MQQKLLVTSKLIMLNIDLTEKKDILTKMANNLISQKYVKKSFLQAVLEREREFPTGLPTNEVGVAIPHADISHVLKPGIAVASLKNPVKFDVMGNPEEQIDVKLVFMLAIKDPDLQINILKQLVSIFQDKQILVKLTDFQEKNELAHYLNSLIDPNEDI